METDYISLGIRIKYYRELKKLSQAKLAKKAVLAQSYISSLEKGKIKDVGINNIAKIAGALNISIDDLLSEYLDNKYPELSDKQSELLNLLKTCDSKSLIEYMGTLEEFIGLNSGAL